MPEINHCHITGVVAEIETLRPAPAGTPRYRLRLEHRSRQSENGHPVEAKVRLPVLLVGKQWNGLVDGLQPGVAVEVEGFLTHTGYREDASERLQLEAVRLERS